MTILKECFARNDNKLMGIIFAIVVEFCVCFLARNIEDVAISSFGIVLFGWFLYMVSRPNRHDWVGGLE